MPVAPIFLVLGWVVLFAAQIIEGGSPASLFSHPAPLLLVFGVTLMVTFTGHSLADLKVVLKATTRAMLPKKLPSGAETVKTLASLADVAKRSGQLELEKQMQSMDGKDPFLTRGVGILLTSTDSDDLAATLELEIEALEKRHKVGAGFWTAAGGYAPTVGILGTVMSLVHVLENLSDPGSLGNSIAAAFLATLWGVASANLIYLPLGSKMKRLTAVEVQHRYLVLEGLLGIQAGDSPRVLTEKLAAALPPSERASLGAE